MHLKDMPIEELELLSYTDMTYLLIKETKKPMNTPTLFREISDLLGYSEEEYTAKIGDYYTSLNIDKRFVLLENNEWDIRDHHSIDILDSDEEGEDEEDTEEEIEEDDTEDNNIEEILDDDLDEDDLENDDLEDLSITDEEDDQLED